MGGESESEFLSAGTHGWSSGRAESFGSSHKNGNQLGSNQDIWEL